MKKSIAFVVTTGVLCAALPQPSSAVTLTAGRIAKFKADKAIIKFIGDVAIAPPFADPRCPSSSSVTITTDQGTLGPLNLTCGLWKQTSSGYLYKDAEATTGVQKILFHTRSDKILIKLKGAPYASNPVLGPVDFVEVRLNLDTDYYCGRFAVPPSTEKKNDGTAVMYKGPSGPCVEPTPTETFTPSVTPTATDTFTAGPSPTPTSTGTSTRTFTPTNTRTATPTFTNTALGAPTATQGPLRAFRVDSIFLRDPHLFIPSLACTDGTELANSLIAGQLTAEDPPGYYNLNLLAIFPNLNQPPAPGGNIEVRTAVCTAVPGAEVCGPDTNPTNATTYVNQAGGVCVEPIDGTTGANNSGTYPVFVPISSSTAPCAGSIPTTITFPLGVFEIPLQDVQVGATYVGSPATALINGLIRGFISEDAAEAITLPPDIPLVGGQQLSSFFAGGQGNCSPNDDRDTGPGAQSGWYVYINFTAHAVTWNP